MGKNGTTAAILPRIAKELAGLDHVPVSSLEPFQGDLKDLSEREYKKLKKSILENGLIVPFFVWLETGKLLDGHQRSRVFIREGWSLDVPIVYISADSEQDAKKKLLVISSQYGRITQDGFDAFTFDLDDDWIKETLQFDALPFVFDFEDEGNGGESKDAEPQISRADELQEIWQVQPGQIWRLPSRTAGQEHRIICGDCTDAAVVERLLNGELIDQITTDPPYGVDYDGGTTKREKLDGDDSPSLYLPALTNWRGFCQPHVAFYLWYADGDQAVAQAVAQAGFKVRRNLIWNKNQAQYGALSQQYKQKHEPFLYGHLKGKSPYWAGDATEITVWDIPRDSVNEMHPTQKPSALYTRAIRNSSKVGNIVFDGFMGSGPAIIAAENLSRQCRAVEIHPPYVAVTLQRYLDAFGIEPELIGHS